MFLGCLGFCLVSCEQKVADIEPKPTGAPKINWDSPVPVSYRIQVGDAISTPQKVTLVTRPRLVDGFQILDMAHTT